MSTSVMLHLQTQMVSIVQTLAKSTIAEISKVIDEGTEVLRLEMYWNKKEKETLKRRLLQMENELRAARRDGKIRVEAGDRIRTDKKRVGDEIRGDHTPDCNSYDEERSLSIDGVFGKEWSISLWKDGEHATEKEVETPLQPVVSEEATKTVDNKPDSFSIKAELCEESLEDSDPQGGPKISGCFVTESDFTECQYSRESGPRPAPAEVTEEPNAQPTAADVTEEPYTQPTAAGGRLGRRTLPITVEGTAEPHISPAPPYSTRASDDARQCVLPDANTNAEGGQERPGRKRLACVHCGRNFSYYISFQKHQQTCSRRKALKNIRFSCQHCTKTFSCSYDLKTHQAIHRDKQFHCNDCGKYYLEKLHLNSHLCQFESQHHIFREGDFFNCEACEKSFTNVSTFDQYPCYCTVQKSHECLECGKCFTERSSLHLHQRTVHAGEKPYSCAECGKSFSQKANLQKHQVIHTGEKPYKCLECGKRFTEKGYLKKHNLMHSGVKPFRCRECGKCFYLKGSLNTHEHNHRSQLV